MKPDLLAFPCAIFDTFIVIFIISDTVPVGGFCYLDIQCTGSPNSGTCENGRCSCSKGFTFIDLACEKGNF